MTLSAAPASPPHRDRLGVWCGWMLVGAAALTPLVGWLGPLAFAPVAALVGLLCLPALRITNEDRPLAVVLLVALIWAAASTTWSPFVPKNPESSTALKLGLELPLYWSAVCAARRADRRLVRLALRVLAWGMALMGLVLFVEAVSGAAIYRQLHILYEGPIRPDLAGKNLGQASFVLALLWPLAAAGGLRAGAPGWLAAPMAVGAVVAALTFDSDAPALAVLLAGAAGLAVWRWPRGGPSVAAIVAAGLFLAMPALVWLVRQSGAYETLQQAVPLSWSMRMGYWSHAIDWIADHPLRGWGLEASRMFAPGIQLHPHNGPLQLWLELGLAGAAAAAAFWALALRRLARQAPDLAAAAMAASAAVYLLFGALNFGVWQEWWLALGALAGAMGVMVARQAALEPST